MGAVLSYDRARTEARTEQREAATVADLTLELRDTYLAALSGKPVLLPYVTTGHQGVPDVERLASVWEDLPTDIDSVPADLVHAVFAKSDCPHVAALKSAMAGAYAARWAAPLIEHRGVEA